MNASFGSGKRHVAVIDSAGAASGMGVFVRTAESRGGSGLCEKSGELRRKSKHHKTGQNERNWSHAGCEYNFVLRPKV